MYSDNIYAPYDITNEQNMIYHYGSVYHFYKLAENSNKNNKASVDCNILFSDYLEFVIQIQWSIVESLKMNFS